MPWKPQGGGPWGGSGGPSGPRPPDIEELLRKGQERFKSFLPRGVGGARGFILIGIAIIAVWLASGFYRVQPGEQGVELMFGRFVKLTTPGLNYWFPSPIGEVITPNVERTSTIDIGFRGVGESSQELDPVGVDVAEKEAPIDLEVGVEGNPQQAFEVAHGVHHGVRRDQAGDVNERRGQQLAGVEVENPDDAVLLNDKQPVGAVARVRDVNRLVEPGDYLLESDLRRPRIALSVRGPRSCEH